MAAEEEESDDKVIKEREAQFKLSHKLFRRLVKKERRRQKRQQAAKKREQEELEEKWRIENDPILRAKLEAKEREEKKRLLEEEKERESQHRLWLEREVIAQERFRKKKEDEERKIREKQEQEERIKREWEEEQRREKEKEERKQKEIKAKEEAIFKELDKPSTAEKSDSWHNPLAPPVPERSYGTEQDTVNCSFYLKTGACRFGERCSRQHPRPSSSVTLMIPAMYNDIRLSQSMLDEADQDTSLEYDEKEAYENFKQFYEDTLPEFRKAGTVVQFKVCCNHEPHLRGNVYVQFSSEEECAKAFAIFNARWYASKQLSCEFSPVTKWKSAICGLFERNRCPRGKNCNFLHVYQNPRNEFSHRDELSPGRTPHNGRWSERSDRDWNREQRNRHRDMDRGRSREGDARYEAKHRKYRERDKSKERDHSRHRHHRRGNDKEHSRGEFYRKKERSKTRDTSSDEDSQSEKEEKQLHQRLSPDVNENVETLIEIVKEERHSHGSKENKKEKNRKRKHHSSHKRRHGHKDKKKHKYHSEQKKKKHRSRSSDSSSSDSDSD